MADDRLGDICWVQLQVMDDNEPPNQIDKWFRGRLRQWVTSSEDSSAGIVELIKEGTAHDVDIENMNFNDHNPNHDHTH